MNDGLTMGVGTTINEIMEKNIVYGMEYPFPSKRGLKYSQDKPMLAQFYKHFAKAYNAMVDCATYGFKKYKENIKDPNWRKNPIDEYVDALFRHFGAYLTGEKLDSESGKQHLAHIIWNACVLYELNNDN